MIMFQYNLIYKNGLWPESHSMPIPVLEEPTLPCASGKEQEPQKELADLWSPGIGPAYLTLHPKVMQVQGQLSRHQPGTRLSVAEQHTNLHTPTQGVLHFEKGQGEWEETWNKPR